MGRHEPGPSINRKRSSLCAIEEPSVAHALDLARGELRVAAVERVVHVVVDRVETRLRTRVLPLGAAGRWRLLSRGVGDEVVRLGAPLVERVLEVEPVAGLVGGRLAL